MYMENMLEKIITAEEDSNVFRFLENIDDIEKFIRKLDNEITHYRFPLDSNTRGATLEFSNHPLLNSYIDEQMLRPYKIFINCERDVYDNDMKKFIELCRTLNPNTKFFEKALLILTV